MGYGLINTSLDSTTPASSDCPGHPGYHQVPTFNKLVGVAFFHGYLAHCTAFLDLNMNETLDSGEPFAATDSIGAFTITLPQARGRDVAHKSIERGSVRVRRGDDHDAPVLLFFSSWPLFCHRNHSSRSNAKLGRAKRQAVLSALGGTYAYTNLSLVVTEAASSATAGYACVDIGTGLHLPSTYFLKAPYPQETFAYSGSPIAISLVSSVAAYLLSGSLSAPLQGPTFAFQAIAGGLDIPAEFDPPGYARVNLAA